MSDPLELLRSIYPRLENGDKKTLSTAVAAINEQLAELADLRSSLDRQPLPEAPASATVKVVDPASQMEWLLTFRFHTEDQLIESVARISGKLPALGVVGFDAYVDGRRAERQEVKALQSPPPPGKPASAGPMGLPPTGEVKTGTGTLMQLTIDTSGKAEFKIDTLQYPLKDSRGAAAVASLFDPSLGWEPGHFAEPALYTQKDFGQLKLDWKKAGKYYDVVRIYS